MKLSISLRKEDVAALDRYMEQHSLSSRSAAVQQAIELLHGPQLAVEYAEAFSEWDDEGDQHVWNEASADGLNDETW